MLPGIRPGDPGSHRHIAKGCRTSLNASNRPQSERPATHSSIPYPLWLSQFGPEASVVLSTRCRIARNIADFPFPWRATELQRKECAKLIVDAIHRGSSNLDHAVVLRPEDLDDAAKDRLIEWRYASPKWKEGGSSRLLAIGRSGFLSILAHEEDHLRLQVILPGLQVESAIEAIEKTQHTLAQYLHFAWCKEFGFLTASLANTGTGMRTGALVHLGGLARTGGIDGVLYAAHELGCSVRGLYGEGSLGTGELFQVSNRSSSLKVAGRIAGKIGATVRYMIQAETRARAELFGSAVGKDRLRVAASLAIETVFGRELPPKELLSTVSVLRLAACEGIIGADHCETAAWVSLAGLAAASAEAAHNSRISFEAMRRSAELRQRLRAVSDR
jgi:protein arginine kinase